MKVAERHHGARGVHSALEFWEQNDLCLVNYSAVRNISGKERTSLLSKCSKIHGSKCMQNKTAVFRNSSIQKPQPWENEKLGSISRKGSHLSSRSPFFALCHEVVASGNLVYSSGLFPIFQQVPAKGRFSVFPDWLTL